MSCPPATPHLSPLCHHYRHCRRGPGTAFEFALALVKALYGEEKMREVAGPMVMREGWDKAL